MGKTSALDEIFPAVTGSKYLKLKSSTQVISPAMQPQGLWENLNTVRTNLKNCNNNLFNLPGMWQKLKIRSLLFCLLGSLVASAETDTAKHDLRLLFIGNSLTYTNDLPALVQEIGKLDGKKISVHSLSLPDHSLEDHWNNGNAETEIEKGIYDIVVLQQGPSAKPESQALLMDYAGRFTKACREHHAKAALYMVWPFKSRLFDLDQVIASYSNAASRTGSLLCPAGKAWKYAWEKDPGLDLYGPDNFHPGIKGSVLAAITIYSVIAEKKNLDFLQWNKCSWKEGIGEQDLNLLKAAALRSIQKL
jgi:hypothetical protein